ncbi:HAD-IIA family hydrolase [Salinarchaeum sp. IM2453]|uniref:HAD-IIA family hydrolase n=1 Tax=Salinarchaeum sp. IM2453 TaxID=2862870 RepID=UPI001C833028|nr:HAD-IIA family hydrolase [Salinarchaeum sp. IM2453]QZA89197.1 HAD-IIA family hydrolase [Salinarchaeum sp. IM2453]
MSTFDGVILDVDGTLVVGSEPISGAVDGFNTLVDAGIQPLLLSNNPTESAHYYRDRLLSCGFDVETASVLTSATITGEYLVRNHPEANLYVVGESGLRDALTDRGLSLTSDPTQADIVVGSIDRGFDYEVLSRGVEALEHARLFVLTDPDPTIPTDGRPMPGSGAVVAALEAAADRSPDITTGKPSTIATDTALNRLSVTPERCLVIGDRLNTDIAMGNRAGMTTALVTTGITDRDTISSSDHRPDYVLDSLAAVDQVL